MHFARVARGPAGDIARRVALRSLRANAEKEKFAGVFDGFMMRVAWAACY